MFWIGFISGIVFLCLTIVIFFVCVETEIERKKKRAGGETGMSYKRLCELTRKERRELNKIVRKQRKEKHGHIGV